MQATNNVNGQAVVAERRLFSATRALYLRREFELLTQSMRYAARGDRPPTAATQALAAALQLPNAEVPATGPSTDGGFVLLLEQIIVLPPPPPPPSLLVPHVGPSPDVDEVAWGEGGWRGVVRVEGRASPWYKGCFGLSITFPLRYPLECPVLELEQPLPSHPLLYDPRSDSPLTRIPVEEVYRSIDPMQTSVLLRLLQHVVALFYPPLWRPPLMHIPDGVGEAQNTINRALAKRDVEGRSATQEVVPGKPFEEFVSTVVAPYLLKQWESDENVDASTFAEWFNSTVRQRVLTL